MKVTSTLFKLITSIVFICTLFTLTAKAQTPTTITGPSDVNTAPPTSSTGANKIICSGSPITLSAPVTSGITYQWYKQNGSAQNQPYQLVGTGNTYTEPGSSTTASGYYNYQLVALNANGCSSTPTTYSVFVLPPINVSVSTNNNTVCSGSSGTGTPSVITATVQNPGSYAYTYAWYKDNSTTPIAGETANTLTVPAGLTQGTTKYTVKVTYTISPTNCPGTASQNITVIDPPQAPGITFSTN